jgi:hypothetical protein
MSVLIHSHRLTAQFAKVVAVFNSENIKPYESFGWTERCADHNELFKLDDISFSLLTEVFAGIVLPLGDDIFGKARSDLGLAVRYPHFGEVWLYRQNL